MNKVLNFERFNRVSNKREKVGYCALYNEADRAVLNFYGDICMYDCSGYGGEYANDKCPQQVADFFNQIEPDKPVEIHFNSGGGDVFAGIAIANIIKAHAGETVGYVDGIAASIASVILCACDRVVIRTGAQVMIHDPMTGCWGNASDFAAVIEQLNIAKDCILELYSTKMSNKVDREALANLMTAETWLTSQNIAEVFSFEVENAEPMVACASTFYDRYTRLPPGVNADTAKDAKKDKILADLYLYGTK